MNDNFEGQGTMSGQYDDGSTYTITGQFKAWKPINATLIVTELNGEKSTAEYRNGIKGKHKKMK